MFRKLEEKYNCKMAGFGLGLTRDQIDSIEFYKEDQLIVYVSGDKRIAQFGDSHQMQYVLKWWLTKPRKTKGIPF